MVAKNTSQALKNLRALFNSSSICKPPISAYVVGTADAHQSEYVAQCDKRLGYISGFYGSVGTAIITATEAAVWTDGRYYVQAAEQVDSNWIVMKDGLSGVPTQAEWISEKLGEGQLVGIDPALCTSNNWNNFSKQLSNFGQKLTPVAQNLINAIWEDRPNRPSMPIIPLEMKYSGCSVHDKIEKMRDILRKEKVFGIVIEALDQIAYMFNLRGTDIPFNPVFFSYAVITLNELFLFTDLGRITPESKTYLESENVSLKMQPYDDFVKTLSSVINSNKGNIWIPGTSSKHVTDIIPEERRITTQSPIELMKAIKNETEKKGMRASHVRDGVALCKYLAMLELKFDSRKFDEISGADELEKFRSKQAHFMGLSFPTISSVGSNAAIIHYQPSESTNKTLVREEIYLVDSGGQYKDGTTDVTRTMHFGEPSKFVKECFTRVLKGVIAIATTVFPTKIPGNAIDAMARKYLWDVGLNYGHGTGHGIGMFLNVHEGPIGITYIPKDDPGLEEGMFVSDEPGYYEDGKFGIRIENIVEIVKAETPYNHMNRGFLTFKTITLAPIQKKLIDSSLLTKDEIIWLNDYHAEIQEKVGARLFEEGDQETYQWLLKQTSPLG